MRACVSIPCFFGKDDFADAVAKVASAGYDAAEIWGWEKLDLERAKKALDENGVELLSMCTTVHKPNLPELRDEFVSGVRKSCEAAKKLGAKMLITQVGQDSGEIREKQHESIVLGLRAAVPVLEEYGVTLMIEPLNILVDHKGYYMPSSAEAFDIVREVGSPYVKVVFDIYHQQITEGNIIPNIVNNLDLIAHLHAAGHPGRHELWLGENDYRFIMRELERAGYKGALGLEYKPTLDPFESLVKTKELYFL